MLMARKKRACRIENERRNAASRNSGWAPRRTARWRPRACRPCAAWRLCLVLLLVVTAAASPDLPQGLQSAWRPLDEGHNMLWSQEKKAAEVERQARARGCGDQGMVKHFPEEDRLSSQMPVDDAPKQIGIISANVHALAPRAEVLAQWDADIVVVQETKLAAHAIRDVRTVLKGSGWDFFHGKPCSPPRARGGEGRTSAATEANSGGVAVMLKILLSQSTRASAIPMTFCMDQEGGTK